jgi:hypothetical protein
MAYLQDSTNVRENTTGSIKIFYYAQSSVSEAGGVTLRLQHGGSGRRA